MSCGATPFVDSPDHERSRCRGRQLSPATLLGYYVCETGDDGLTDVPFLRNSERHDFKRCILRWHWRYNEHLVLPNVTTGPLVFGTLGHLALAEWYIPGKTRGVEPQETWAKLTKELWDTVNLGPVTDEVEAEWTDARQLGDAMLGNYRRHYGTDDHWEVLWVEDQFHQRIPHPADLQAGVHPPRPIVEYVGTIDLIVRNHETGQIEYVDHKFMKTIETDHLYIDDQNGGYLAIGTHELRKRGLIGEKEAIRALVYNFLRKALPPDRPQNAMGQYLNQDGTVSKRQPPAFFHRERIERTGAERNRQIQRIGEEALHHNAVRSGALPIIKNPTKDCRWDCSFFDLCSIHESGGDLAFAKKTLYKKENPYSEYETGAESPKVLGHKGGDERNLAE